MQRLTVETFTKPLKQHGLIKWTGKIDGLAIKIDLENLAIEYGREAFKLERLLGTKGGYRYFFCCPICGRRCRVLYKAVLLHACGQCMGVHKTTLNRSKTDCQYYWSLAMKEARKVQPDYTAGRKGYIFGNFPARPKRMKRDRYYKHYQRFVNYIRKGDSLWLNGLNRLEDLP